MFGKLRLSSQSKLQNSCRSRSNIFKTGILAYFDCVHLLNEMRNQQNIKSNSLIVVRKIQNTIIRRYFQNKF